MACSATTRAGGPCRRPPGKGKTRCWAHSGGTDVGRPDGLTEAAADRIVNALRAGAYTAEAAAHAGVSVRTFQRWRARGEQADAEERYRTFAERAAKAEAEAKVFAIGIVRTAMSQDWRAAAWLLEHRWPQEWGRRNVEVTGPEGGPVEVQEAGRWDLGALSDEELELLETLRKKASDGDG
jgi:transposase